MTYDDMRTQANLQRIAQLRTLHKAEAAEILGVSPEQIDKLRLAGALRGIRCGKEWRYSQTEIVDFLAAADGQDVSGPENMRKLAQQRRGK